ncbi:MAG: ABC transporter permease subunit [Angelakisella sp.]
MKKQRKITPSGIYLALVLLFIYLPVVVVVLYSFNVSKSDVLWTGFTLDWYRKMAGNRVLMEALKNSMIVAVLSCTVSAVIGTIGAVGLSRWSFRSKGLLENLAMLPIMIPEIILGMVFLAFFSFLHLPFGMLTLIIGHTSFCIPYIFLVVKGRLVGLDPSIGEAARDLGAGEWRMFFDITLPLIAPAVLSGTLLAFAMSLDDVVISFFVTGAQTNTLPIKIYSQIKFGVTPEINALCTVMLLITFVLIFVSGKIGSKHSQSSVPAENQG